MWTLSRSSTTPKKWEEKGKSLRSVEVDRVDASYCPALAHGAGTFSHPKGHEEIEPVSTEK